MPVAIPKFATPRDRLPMQSTRLPDCSRIMRDLADAFRGWHGIELGDQGDVALGNTSLFRCYSNGGVTEKCLMIETEACDAAQEWVFDDIG